MSTGSFTPKVFLREATGLVKEIGLRNILAFNLINISFGTSIIYILSAMALFPGGDPLMGTLITALLFIPLGVVYAMMLVAMPRAGGDYVFVSRTLHPALGFLLAFTFILWVLFWTGAFMNWIFTFALGPALSIIGSLENNASLTSLSSTVTSNNFVIGAGIVLLVILGLIGTFFKRVMLRLTTYSLYAGLVSVIMMAIALAITSPDTFISRFNAYAAPSTGTSDYYHQIISGAGANYSAYGWSATIGLIPIAAFMFLYVSAQQIVGGEIKNVRKSSYWSIALTFLIGGGFGALLIFLTVHVMGYNFLIAAASTPGAPVTLYYNALVGLLVDNPALLWIMELLFCGWYIAIPLLNFYFVPRYLLATSMDRVTPGFFARVSERFHTPTVGIWMVVVFGSIMLIIYTEYVSLFGTLSAVLTELIAAYLLVSVAAILFPFTKGTRDIYRASPITYKIAGFPLISIMGIISTVILVGVGYMMLSNATYGLNSFYSLLAIVLTVVVGLAIYIVSYFYRRSQGLNLGLAFKQIPPE